MEVISLNERDRSATILNTAPPSDDYDDVTLDVVVGQEADDFVAPNEFINDDDEAAAVSNNNGEGGGTWNKNKLLLSIIAGTAMLCAVAAGGGVAAHNARMAASAANNCPTAGIRPPPVAIGSAKTLKSGGRIVRNLEEDETIITTGGAYYPDIPKTIEDKRKNRMLAEHLGHKAASFAWLDYYLDGLKFAFTNGNKQHQQVRRLQTTPKSLKSTSNGSVQLPEIGENCKCVAAIGGSPFPKSSKVPKAKSSKAPKVKSSKAPKAKTSKTPKANAIALSPTLCNGIEPPEEIIPPETVVSPTPTEPTPAVIHFPVGFPTSSPNRLESYAPSIGASVTVGEPNSSSPTGGNRGETEAPSSAPSSKSTGLSTGAGSFGDTVTVSTETTGPPTAATRVP